VVKGAPNHENAVRFIEYLASTEAQTIFAGGNKEYAVALGNESVPELASFGEFTEDRHRKPKR